MTRPSNPTRPPAAVPIECDAAEALVLARTGRGYLIDIRQPFELELKGVLPGALQVPFFHFKQHFGLELDDEEQELLDADAPQEDDALNFVHAVQQLQRRRNSMLLLVCNSGRRSLLAAHLLRGMGYQQAYSVRGGMHELASLLPPG